MTRRAERIPALGFRMLIAQAQIERLPIVTADPAFGAYDVPVIWE